MENHISGPSAEVGKLANATKRLGEVTRSNPALGVGKLANATKTQ